MACAHTFQEIAQSDDYSSRLSSIFFLGSGHQNDDKMDGPSLCMSSATIAFCGSLKFNLKRADMDIALADCLHAHCYSALPCRSVYTSHPPL